MGGPPRVGERRPLYFLRARGTEGFVHISKLVLLE
jgi:hypothetical protein